MKPSWFIFLETYFFGRVIPRLYLTLFWRRPLSHRNQSIDFQGKSMDWFLYDNGLRHERVNVIHLSSMFHAQRCIQNHVKQLRWNVLRKKLTLRVNRGQKEKINLKFYFYFHTSLWCLKSFHETIWGTSRKCENKNLS